MAKAKGKIENVILITIDALRYDHLGCNNPQLKERGISPNLDLLAKRSANFNQAFSQGPYTRASFPVIFFSNYLSRVAKVTGPKISKGKIKKSAQSWVESLQKAGVETAGFTTNPLTGRFLGYGKGFDLFDDRDRPFSFFTRRTWPVLDRFLKATLIKRLKKFFFPNVFIDSPYINTLAFNWLKKRKEKPFFLWLHYMDVHEPYYGNLNPALAEKGKAKKHSSKKLVQGYLRGVKLFDRSFGRFIDYLRKEKFLEDTLIILTADHGDSFGEHQIFSHPGKLYQELTHVPLLIFCPGQSGRRENSLIGLVDLGPTILDFLKAKEPIPSKGISFKSLVGGENKRVNQTSQAMRKVIISEVFSSTEGEPGVDFSPHYSIQTKRYKLIVLPDNKDGGKIKDKYGSKDSEGQEELYDLKEDPKEKYDISDKKPDIVRDLKKRFKEEYYGQGQS